MFRGNTAWPTHVTWLALASIIAIAALARFLTIGDQSIWYDEAASLWFSGHSIQNIWNELPKHEPHPPLYYFMLNGWIAVFGDSASAVRSMSAIANLATIPLVYVIGRQTAGPKLGREVGLVASLVFALSTAQIAYAQEARMYALWVFAMAAVLAATTTIVRNHADAPEASAQPWTPYIALGVSTALLPWFQHLGGLIAAYLGVVLGLWWVIATSASRGIILRLIVAGLVCLLLSAPAIAYFVSGLALTQSFWLDAPNLVSLVLETLFVFGGAFGFDNTVLDVGARILVFAAWPVLGVIAIARSSEAGMRQSGAILLAMSAGLLVLFVVVSYTIRPIVMARTLLPAAVGWSVLCALGVTLFAGKQARSILVTALALAFMSGAAAFLVYKAGQARKVPMNRIAEYMITAEAQPVKVYASFYTGLTLGYYFTRMDPDRHTVVFVPEHYDPALFNNEQDPITIGTLTANLAMLRDLEDWSIDGVSSLAGLRADLAAGDRPIWIIVHAMAWRDGDDRTRYPQAWAHAAGLDAPQAEPTCTYDHGNGETLDMYRFGPEPAAPIPCPFS